MRWNRLVLTRHPATPISSPVRMCVCANPQTFTIHNVNYNRLLLHYGAAIAQLVKYRATGRKARVRCRFVLCLRYRAWYHTNPASYSVVTSGSSGLKKPEREYDSLTSTRYQSRIRLDLNHHFIRQTDSELGLVVLIIHVLHSVHDIRLRNLENFAFNLQCY